MAKKIKFGDLEVNSTIYYIHPFLKIIEPAFVMGIEDKPSGFTTDHTKLILILVPKEEREKPLTTLDPNKLRKIVMVVKKSTTSALVITKPPTMYATTQSELSEYMGLKKP